MQNGPKIISFLRRATPRKNEITFYNFKEFRTVTSTKVSPSTKALMESLMHAISWNIPLYDRCCWRHRLQSQVSRWHNVISWTECLDVEAHPSRWLSHVYFVTRLKLLDVTQIVIVPPTYLLYHSFINMIYDTRDTVLFRGRLSSAH